MEGDTTHHVQALIKEIWELIHHKIPWFLLRMVAVGRTRYEDFRTSFTKDGTIIAAKEYKRKIIKCKELAYAKVVGGPMFTLLLEGVEDLGTNTGALTALWTVRLEARVIAL